MLFDFRRLPEKQVNLITFMCRLHNAESIGIQGWEPQIELLFYITLIDSVDKGILISYYCWMLCKLSSTEGKQTNSNNVFAVSRGCIIQFGITKDYFLPLGVIILTWI